MPTRDRALSGTNEGREPHAISLKVLRLSRPSLANQHPISTHSLSPNPTSEIASLEFASYSYPTASSSSSGPGPFILSPLLTFPPAFGAAYAGELFSCCLCANNCSPVKDAEDGTNLRPVKDVKVTAQMQTPSLTTELVLTDGTPTSSTPIPTPTPAPDTIVLPELQTGDVLQKIVKYDLKEAGNHVLSVTVSYQEPIVSTIDGVKTEGYKLRTFRKLYQFVVMQCLTVRTKTGEVPSYTSASTRSKTKEPPKNVILEAQLENMAETPISLDTVSLFPKKGWTAKSLNWDNEAPFADSQTRVGEKEKETPMLKNRDIMQVAFLLEPDLGVEEGERKEEPSAQLKIEWRSAGGERGFLSTGWLGVKRKP